MNKFEFKNLTPFKWFVLENFPFIEADFDALTEWQLFCKIGKEINKIITSQNLVGKQAEDLTKAFNDLYNYVDNYFNNLDVQSEINNKLNEMAEDGTLAQIIEDYATIPELTEKVTKNENDITELNNNLNNFKENINSKELTEMIVIGDSYSSRTYLTHPNKLWCEIVSERLKLNLHNYADSGSGFLSDGDERQTTFNTQINEAYNDNSFNNNKVKYLFIFGGTNDLKYYPASNSKNIYYNAYDTTLNNARQKFPNAKIIYLGCDTFQNFNTKEMDDTENITELWIDYTIKNRNSFINNSIISLDLTLFFVGMSNYFTDSLYGHPNALAHKEFAKAVINGLFSSSNAFLHLITIEPTTDSSNYELVNSLYGSKIYQLRLTDKGFDLFLQGCLHKLNSSEIVKINLPFNLRIPYSSDNNNKFLPLNHFANIYAYSDNHDTSSIIAQQNNLFDFPYGRNYLEFYELYNISNYNYRDFIINVNINI